MADTPLYDGRGEDDLVSHAETLVAEWTGWRPSPEDDLDLGGALIRLFGRMARRAVEHVDAAPDRHAAELFRLLGVQPRPPGVARAALVFTPADGAPRDPIVRADTELAAKASGEFTEDAIFYTEGELRVLRAPLSQVWAYDAGGDMLDEVTASALPTVAEALGLHDDGPWSAFGPHTPFDRSLYIACDVMLAGGTVDEWSITLGNAEDRMWEEFVPSFAWFDGTSWVDLPVRIARGNPEGVEYRLPPIAAPRASVVAGVEACWIRMRIESLPAGITTPRATEVVVAHPVQFPARAPAVVLRGLSTVDTSIDFAPFGAAPRFNDLICFDGGAALSPPNGCRVTVAIILSQWQSAAQPTSDLIIAWEVLGADGWVAVGYSKGADNNTPVPQVEGFEDGTDRFARAGEIRFNVPRVPLAPHAGLEGRWVRARIVKGDYGQAASWTANANGQVVETPSTLRPPWLTSLRVSSAGSFGLAAWRTDAVLVARSFAGLESLVDAPGMRVMGMRERGEPAVYFAFDQPLGDVPATLFVEVHPPIEDGVTGMIPVTDDWDPEDPAQLQWQISTDDGWQTLHVDDDTRALSRSGIVRFLAPTEAALAEQFGRRKCWVRARWVDGTYHHLPLIHRVYLNAIWARAARDYAEVIGSGTGGPDQAAKLTRTPVLAGERIEVRENDGEWHTWTSVPDFNGSGTRDRHYVVDPSTGDVTFGDGRRAMVPPLGSDNIRARYTAGGGQSGNRPANSITDARGAMPYVDSVTNPAPAEGGRDPEDIEMRVGDVPRSMRHRERAVAAVDFIDLAREASETVARVSVIEPEFFRDNPVTFDVEAQPVGRGGWIKGIAGAEVASGVGYVGQLEVIVVPKGDSARPNPTQALLDTVHGALRRRSDPNLMLRVTGPRWVTVTVEADLGATIAGATDVEDRALAALDAYLHPLTGGGDGAGWPFGRRPRESDILAVLSAVEGVEFVRGLVVDCNPPLPLPEFVGVDHERQPGELTARQAQGALVTTGHHMLQVVVAR